MCGWRIFAGPHTIYHLLGNVIPATVGLVYVQPEYELPSSTRFGQFQTLEKFELGALSFPATPKEKFLHEI